MKLRLARPEETDTLAAFCGVVYGVQPSYFWRRWQHDPASGSFGVILESAGRLVGYAHVFDRLVMLDREPGRCAGIGNVAVTHGERQRGHAGALVERCLREAEARGFELSLLYTHLPRVYEASGYRVVPTHDVVIEGTATPNGWLQASRLSTGDQRLYERAHRHRPGTIVRNPRYWAARERWLRPEGWRIFKHHEADGYCFVRQTGPNQVIDESAGGCAALLAQGGPGPGSWRRRVPPELATGLPSSSPPESYPMVRRISREPDIAALYSPAAVFWATDAF